MRHTLRNDTGTTRDGSASTSRPRPSRDIPARRPLNTSTSTSSTVPTSGSTTHNTSCNPSPSPPNPAAMSSPVRRKPVGSGHTTPTPTPSHSPMGRKPVGSNTTTTAAASASASTIATTKNDPSTSFWTEPSGLDHCRHMTVKDFYKPVRSEPLTLENDGSKTRDLLTSIEARKKVRAERERERGQAAFDAAQGAYLRGYAQRNRGTRISARKAKKKDRGVRGAWTEAYAAAAAGPSDGEELGRLVRGAWESWQRGRKGGAPGGGGDGVGERERFEKRRDERLARWLEKRMKEEELGEMVGLPKVERRSAREDGGDTERHRPRRSRGEQSEHHRNSRHGSRHGSRRQSGEQEPGHSRGRHSSSHHRHHHRRGSGANSNRAGSSLYAHSSHTQHHQHKPDDLDLFVAKVSDKVSQWTKDISERAAEAKLRKREERKEREREALKKTISAPRPADDAYLSDAVSDAEWGRGRPGAQSRSSSCGSSVGRPSYSSDRSNNSSRTRRWLPSPGGSPRGDGKFPSSFAERSKTRKKSIDLPFWPSAKKDKKADSVVSSAQVSPAGASSFGAFQQRQQQQEEGGGGKFTLAPGADYDKRGTQIGQFLDPALAQAPWNQSVNKASPWAPKHAADKDKETGKHPQNQGSSGSGFFGKFMPSPTFMQYSPAPLSSSSQKERKGSDESFFGCMGISIAEERAAQSVNQQAHEQRQLQGLDFRPPPTPPVGARELFGKRRNGGGEKSGSAPSRLAVSGGQAASGGSNPFADAADDDDIDSYYTGSHHQPPAAMASASSGGSSLRMPPLQGGAAAHSPAAVSGPFVARQSMAAELVVSGGGDDGNARRHTPSRDDDYLDNRVSWWDPPDSPIAAPALPPPPKTKGKGKVTQREVEKPYAKVSKPLTEGKSRLQYWEKYRKGLRDTTYQKDSGLEGRPF